MKDLYNERYELLKNGESFVLATLFNSEGSSPRTAGAKMIIKGDNTIVGTVGGGLLEAKIISDGREVLKSEVAIQRDYKLDGIDKGGIDMVCGGSVSALIEYIDAGLPENLKLYEEVVSCLKKGEKAFFIRSFLNNCCKVENYFYKNNELISDSYSLEKKEIEAIVKDVLCRDLQVIRDKDKFILVEPIWSGGTVYIFGAGHVSQKLADLTNRIDFRTFVLDDRAEFANRERFPYADEIEVVESFNNCFEGLNIDSDSLIVIVTRGHLHDLTVIKEALKTDAYYIGMIGSSRKREMTYKALELEGFTAEDFARVHSPIGLEIYAETPEEIAISIAAEMIKVRGEKTLNKLCL